jgi:hypothetical protein
MVQAFGQRGQKPFPRVLRPCWVRVAGSEKSYGRVKTRMWGRRALRAMVVACSMLLAPAPAEAAKPKPDLSVSKAASSAGEVAQDGPLNVTWTIKNGGKGAAGKSTTTLVLSTDAKFDAKDVKLGIAAQKGLGAKKTATGKLSAKVPATLAARRYSLSMGPTPRATRSTRTGSWSARAR